MREVTSVRTAVVGEKRVLLRVDYNVPFENGVIVDDSRIRATLPTVSLLRDRGASKIILITHLGRPGGKRDAGLSTEALFKHLSSLVSTTHIEMLENVRFDPREEANDESFAKELSQLGDVYVNEAFSNAHRTHASMIALPKLLPSFIGLQFESEITHLSKALTPPDGSVALLAVTKKDKLPLAEKLAQNYRAVLLGGPVPSDYVPAKSNILAPTDGIPQREGLMDIGPQTRAHYAEAVASAPFVLWNGPLGWFEKGYTESTDVIAQTIVDKKIPAVIGGGDTLNALKKFAFDPQKVFLSTGGGAMLHYLSEGTLPALDALRK